MERQVMADILGKNDSIAASNNHEFSKHGILVINLLGSPGSGKTSFLERTISYLKKNVKIAVIEGDLFTEKDAMRIARLDIPVIQINTSGGCHLDALMVQKVLPQLDLANLDLLFIENVGNLVCPAEFQVGEDIKVVVLSITEGNDKPLKYPLVFKESVASIINKTDLIPYTNFSVADAKRDIKCIHPQAVIFPVSCVNQDGLADWYCWLNKQLIQKKRQISGGGK